MRRSRVFDRIISAVALAAVLSVGNVYAFDDGANVVKDEKTNAVWSVIGPDGGDVRSVVIDPKDKDRLYISTLDGQIHTSADSGRTWRLLVNFEKPQLIIDDLIVDPRDSNVIYASGHRHKGAGGFFKTTDGGRTWKEAKELRNEPIHALAQADSDPNYLFAGTTDGVWVSKNSGDDWEKIESSSMPVNVNSLAIDPRTTGTIYAGTWWRPYKSTDNGKNWSLIKEGMIDDSDVFAITINSKNQDHIVASACSGIYESLNGGAKWRKIQGIPSTSRRTRDIVQHPSKQGTLYAATTEGFWMSSNGGAAWKMTTPKSLEINAIAVHPDAPDRVFIATNVNGVMVSNDGGNSFTPTNANFTSRFAYTVSPDIAKPGRLYATTHNTASSGGAFYISDNGGASWKAARGLDPNRIAPFAILQDRVDPNRIFLGTNDGVYRSLDRGESWTLLTAPKAAKKAPARKGRMTAAQRKAAEEAAKKAALEPKLVPALDEKVNVLAFTEDDKNGIIAGTDTGLYRTYDITKGWEKLSFGEGVTRSITAVFSSPLVPGTIWVGTTVAGVLVSRDDGKTWNKTGEFNQNIPVVAIAGDPKRPNYLYAGTTQALYLTRDGGRTWMFRGGNLPLGKYASILINPENTDEIFVASAHETSSGVFYSTDAGMRWKRFDSKEIMVASRRVWAMAFDPSDPGRIYAATQSSGIYQINRPNDFAKAKPGDDAAARVDGN
ncbi:MAG: YCF48-related protein [Pyrinomonadaceae bacterium]|nr:YCF48-related protein [Pyrinomonadaceae bacterium]